MTFAVVLSLLINISQTSFQVEGNLLGEDVAWVVVHRGETIYESYPEQYPPEYLHHIHSVTKSVVSILTGIAIDKGILPVIHTPIHSLFPEYRSHFSDPLKSQITLYHLLSMSSGIHWRGGIGGEDLLAMLESEDWEDYVLQCPMSEAPGETFNYNSGGTHLLSALIQREYSGTTAEFAEKYLFMPLGIEEWSWNFLNAPDGTTAGAWGLHLTVMDMAEIGELMRNSGVHHGFRIVSEEWVDLSTSIQFARPDNEADYGFQWWLPRNFSAKTVCARGWYGDHSAFIYIFPKMELVVTTAGGRPDPEGLEELISLIIL